jgi:mono/diheme cytochrome c family protein
MVVARLLITALIALGALGCRRDMQDQPRYDAFETSAFFADGRASRPRVPGTVARGHLQDDPVFFTGKDATGAYAVAAPMPATRDLLARGQERFNIYCTPCHDRTGSGQGIVVQRGYKRPPSFHEDRLRALPIGYFVDVVTHGFATMPSYAAQIPPADRWAIATYLRALQRSQHATIADVPPSERPSLDVAAAPPSLNAETAPPIPPLGPGSNPQLPKRPASHEAARAPSEPGSDSVPGEPGPPGPQSGGHEGQPAKEGLPNAPHEGR